MVPNTGSIHPSWRWEEAVSTAGVWGNYHLETSVPPILDLKRQGNFQFSWGHLPKYRLYKMCRCQLQRGPFFFVVNLVPNLRPKLIGYGVTAARSLRVRPVFLAFQTEISWSQLGQIAESHKKVSLLVYKYHKSTCGAWKGFYDRYFFGPMSFVDWMIWFKSSVIILNFLHDFIPLCISVSDSTYPSFKIENKPPRNVWVACGSTATPPPLPHCQPPLAAQGLFQEWYYLDQRVGLWEVFLVTKYDEMG